ncbi:MAG: hypothetical protein KME06_13030 [Kastovskya adunca ATA6-11-RM4]|nr:hypothetical protein [Kastovskya adunca ATA6-11-RM4]
MGIVGWGTGGLGASVLMGCCGVGSGLGVSVSGFSSISGSSTTMNSIGSLASSGCFSDSQLMPKPITPWNTAEPTRLIARNFLRASCSFSRCSMQKLEMLMP